MTGVLEGIFTGLAAQHLIRKVQQDKVKEALENENYREAIELADGSDLEVLTNAIIERAESANIPVSDVKSRLLGLNPNISFPDRL